MVSIKSKEEIVILRQGGKILGRILRAVADKAKIGVSTAELEEIACALIEKSGGRPAFKNYEIHNGRYFPTALCTSINEEIVHGPAVPGRILKNGDLLSIDIGMEWPVRKAEQKKIGISNSHSSDGGFYTDTALSVPIGKISAKNAKLLRVTKKSLEIGIAEARPGNTLNNLGRAIQRYVEKNGFSVVRDLVGHGVGYQVHESAPEVFNYEFTKYGIPDTILKPGMVIAIEPMITAGSYHIKSGRGGYAMVTADGSMAAHFEHTVAIKEKGNIVITE
ncbi:MAG: type I methionyl aminopeptidase [Patescibacteria group bacterium]|jgi:methionyl aminopeptidase